MGKSPQALPKFVICSILGHSTDVDQSDLIGSNNTLVVNLQEHMKLHTSSGVQTTSWPPSTESPHENPGRALNKVK